MRPRVFVVALLLLILAAPLQGVVLDQYHEPTNENGALMLGGLGAAQTFSVGVEGDLVSVDVLIHRRSLSVYGDLFFDIRRTEDGVPVADDGDVLVSAIIPHDSIPLGEVGNSTFVPVVFSGSAVPVVVGDILALVLRSPEGGQHVWGFGDDAYGERYAGGLNYFRSGSSGEDAWYLLNTQDDDDYRVGTGFRTYVQPVPEPVSLTLFCCAGILLKPHRRTSQHPPGGNLLHRQQYFAQMLMG